MMAGRHIAAQHFVPICSFHTDRGLGIRPPPAVDQEARSRPGRRVSRSSIKKPPSRMIAMKENNPKSGATKPAGAPFDMPKTATPHALHQFAENGAAQLKASYAKMSAATAEASSLMQSSYT